jgi:hypothetical protein
MNKVAYSQQTYIQSSRASQLESIANHLKQIAEICSDANDLSSAIQVIRESQYFIEWTVPTLPIDDATELVDLGRVLAGWKLQWSEISTNSARILIVHNLAQNWHDRLLRSIG